MQMQSVVRFPPVRLASPFRELGGEGKQPCGSKLSWFIWKWLLCFQPWWISRP